MNEPLGHVVKPLRDRTSPRNDFPLSRSWENCACFRSMSIRIVDSIRRSFRYGSNLEPCPSGREALLVRKKTCLGQGFRKGLPCCIRFHTETIWPPSALFRAMFGLFGTVCRTSSWREHWTIWSVPPVQRIFPFRADAGADCLRPIPPGTRSPRPR